MTDLRKLCNVALIWCLRASEVNEKNMFMQRVSLSSTFPLLPLNLLFTDFNYLQFLKWKKKVVKLLDIPDGALHFPSKTSSIFKLNKTLSLPFILWLFNVDECMCVHAYLWGRSVTLLFNSHRDKSHSGSAPPQIVANSSVNSWPWTFIHKLQWVIWQMETNHSAGAIIYLSGT